MNRTRRQNGEGSICRVSENKWIGKISLGPRPDGGLNVKQFSGRTEAIVKKKLKEFKKSPEFLGKHAPSSFTVRSYLSKWLYEYQYSKLKPSSYDRIESTIVNHIFPHIGALKIDKVSKDNIQSLINHLYKKKNLSYSSIKKVYVALNSCYKHALIDDVVVKNPCIGIELPSRIERTKKVVPLSQEEVQRLKEEILKTLPNGAHSCYYGHAFLLILNTGLRMGEALSLCWEDIDFENKIITVSKNNIITKRRDVSGKAVGGYELHMQNSPKTTSGNRTIPMNNSAESALLELRKGNSTPYVIINSRGNQVLPSNFERSFHALLKRAEINGNYGVHALRHTFASMLFSKGVDVKIVSKLLGHSSVKITYDTYVHLFENDIKCVTNVLD